MSKEISITNFINDEPQSNDLAVPLRAIGIDLGTTNSTVAECSIDNFKEPIPDTQCIEVPQETESGLYTHYLVPSAIAILQGKEWIGEGAKRLRPRASELGLRLTKDMFFECKNEIGTRRTYHTAPEGYQSPEDIASKIIAFLSNAAVESNQITASRTVITVPASFQTAQRNATVTAAKNAGINLSSGDLLDEPIAAYIDYVFSYGRLLQNDVMTARNLLVFDFGGGTCDVAIFRLSRSEHGSLFDISPISVSRYHRLGGGDIDRAILYEVLLPQIIEQNKLTEHDLSFEDKKNKIEPAFIGVAEALKIGISNEISRLNDLGTGEDTALIDRVMSKQPGVFYCTLDNRRIELSSPSITLEQFSDVLEPFLDQELTYARETEYTMSCSIFAPINDALSRCGLEPSDIDIILFAGGSSLLLAVTEAVKSYMPKAAQLLFPDKESAQVAVARGAAIHSLVLSAYGRGIVQPVVHDRISIRTKDGSFELIPKGVALPFPGSDEWMRVSDLTVPETSNYRSIKLRVEILAGDVNDERLLEADIWEMKPPVTKGDKLILEYRIDENQLFEFKLTLADNINAKPYNLVIENPLTNVVNPNSIWEKIQKAEEELRSGAVPKEEQANAIVEIAEMYSSIGQHEKAISYLVNAARIAGSINPDELSHILNLLGIEQHARRDYAKAEKSYREAHKAGGGSAPLFNLALMQRQLREYEKANETIVEMLTINDSGPYLTLAALNEKSLKNPRAIELAEEAIDRYPNLPDMSDWELGWYITAAGLVDDPKIIDAAKEEQKKRNRRERTSGKPSGVLPEITGLTANNQED